MKRIASFYLVTLTLVGIGILAVLHLGASLPAPQVATELLHSGAPKVHPAHSTAVAAVMSGLAEHANEPLSHLFVQLLVIIAASRLVGMVFARCGQPSVVGEMAAGILLGPSLFGLVAPGAFQFVFPATSLGVLKLLSQVGVCLFITYAIVIAFQGPMTTGVLPA